MKKVLPLIVLTIGFVAALSGCAPIASLPPVADAIKDSAAMVVSQGKESGTVDIAVGGKAIRNVAVTLSGVEGGTLTLTKAPDGAQCAYVKDAKPTQIYCRLGDMGPLTSAQAKYAGTVGDGKLGYINSDGVTKVIGATLVKYP